MSNHDYLDRHNAEWQQPRNDFARAIKLMYRGWEAYALAHRARYHEGIGSDGVLGEHWEDIGHALIGLLNGETGSEIDCGTLEGLFRETLRLEGCKDER